MSAISESTVDSHRSGEATPSAGTNFMNRLGNIGEAFFEVILDRELRRKAKNLVVSEAGKQMKGIQEVAASHATTIQGVPRHVQGLIARINKQIQLNRREMSLRARRDQPVDVQVGADLWEDAPQELRSRLWIALLCNSDLIGNLVEEKIRCQQSQSPQASSSGEARQDASDPATDSRGDRSNDADASSSSLAVDSLPHGTPVDTGQTTRRADLRDEASESTTGTKSREADDGAAGSGVEPLRDGGSASLQQSNSAAETTEENGSSDAWEIIQDSGSWNNAGSSQTLAQTLRKSTSGSALTLKDKLLAAMCEVDWPISVIYQENCRYDTLCQISVGQEEIEEVIERDIDRTFPEHPQFSFEQGQQQLFRVLKAYSLHDIQVGYCQGMAFVTGVILMYVPEEPAFRLLTRLMDERGANLRHLYLPGLEGLKNYLRMLEWLLDRTHPELKAHLEEYGVSPVLFASQWFLTAFSCPFPASFSCRIIDVMLTENNGHAMLRVALSVMKACAAELMELHDFESLITYLKVQPVKWSTQATRRVLNEAIQGFISDDMLAAASQAVADSYDGSLPRTRPNAPPASDQQTVDASEPDRSTTLTLPNQISGADAALSSDGQEESGDVEQGGLVEAVDALWIVNADQSI